MVWAFGEARSVGIVEGVTVTTAGSRISISGWQQQLRAQCGRSEVKQDPKGVTKVYDQEREKDDGG